MQGLIKCRALDCTSLFPTDHQRLRHERNCDIVAQQLSSIAYRQGQFPLEPPRLDIQLASINIDIDSDDSTAVPFTPGNSRTPSICDANDRRQSGGVIRTVRRRYRSASSTPESVLKYSSRPKRIKKQKKEKFAREQQGSCLWRNEDFLRNYVRWERREQSGGNGNGAGLNANKTTIMRAAEDLLYHFIHEQYCLGIQHGDLEARQEKMRRILDRAADNLPYSDTFMATDGELLCAHEDSRSKECIVHGHPDWRECRRLHTDPRFVRKRDEYVDQLERQRLRQEAFLMSRGSSSTQRRGAPR